MDDISRVIQRITTIEQRFSTLIKPAATNFATTLESAEISQNISSPATTGNWDIEKIITAAAKKYNVDSKLAMAVAITESNLQPQAVSAAGAVGVMQLMPETAKRLGVRNLKDPRENIDGGVHYLKQLLTTFNGDVVKAVAAYNAGPSAVMHYNGVPPYAETQNYVDKVMALNG